MNQDLPQLITGPRYVFYKSLLKEKSELYKSLASMAQDMLNNVQEDISLNKENQSTNRIKYALDFLGAAAKFERTKEVQFFQKFKQEYPEAEQIFNINLTNPSEEDYIFFIKNINIALKGANIFKQRLDTEIKRISRVKEFRRTGNDLALEYNKNAINQRVNQANKDSLTFFKRGGQSGAKKGSGLGGEQNFYDIFQRRTNMSRITSLILQEYGPQLFKQGKNILQLSSKQIAALIKALTDEAYAMFISQYELISQNTLIDAQQIILGQDFEKFFNDLMGAPDLSNVLDDIAKQYSLGYDTQTQVRSDKIKSIKEDLLKNFSQIRSTLPTEMTEQEWLNFIGASDNELKNIYRSILTVSAQAYYTGEDLNLIELARNKIYAALGGSAQPTDDIYAGKLIITPNLDIDNNSLERSLASIGRRAYSNIVALNDINTFFSNAKQLRDARKEQLEKLQEMEKQVSKTKKAGEYLLSHVNIHTTIKGYTGAEGTTFIKEGGFKGASFGSTLPMQLNILNQLADSGGFDIGDLEYLQFAMINAGSQMMGHYLKSSLEDYFSIFVSFLMFNDAELMFEDISNWMKDNTISSVNDIHLYELNGITIPTSFLLENTYSALLQISNDIPTKTNKYGSRAILSTHNGGPVNHSWVETAKTAEEKTSLEIHFLAGFLDILDKINKAMP